MYKRGRSGFVTGEEEGGLPGQEGCPVHDDVNRGDEGVGDEHVDDESLPVG
jgi:hypothetical protein